MGFEGDLPVCGSVLPYLSLIGQQLTCIFNNARKKITCKKEAKIQQNSLNGCLVYWKKEEMLLVLENTVSADFYFFKPFN